MTKPNVFDEILEGIKALEQARAEALALRVQKIHNLADSRVSAMQRTADGALPRFCANPESSSSD